MSGVFVKDILHVDMISPGAAIGTGKLRFQFGCHSHETKLFQQQAADGIMGLAKHKRNFVDALVHDEEIERAILALCLSSDGGYMSVGGFDASLHDRPIQWASLSFAKLGFYVVQLGFIKVGATTLDVDPREYKVGYGTVFDSGTTITYLPSPAYKKFYEAFAKQCTDANCNEHKSQMRGEKACWRPPLLKLRAGFFQYFPVIELSIGSITMTVRPHQYLYKFENGVYCVGVGDNYRAGTVLGANFMSNHDIVFDLDNQKLGVAPSSCRARVRDAQAVQPVPAPGAAEVAAETASADTEATAADADADATPGAGKKQLLRVASPLDAARAPSTPMADGDASSSPSTGEPGDGTTVDAPPSAKAPKGGLSAFTAFVVILAPILGLVAIISGVILLNKVCCRLNPYEQLGPLDEEDHDPSDNPNLDASAATEDAAEQGEVAAEAESDAEPGGALFSIGSFEESASESDADLAPPATTAAVQPTDSAAAAEAAMRAAGLSGSDQEDAFTTIIESDVGDTGLVSDVEFRTDQL